MNEKHQSDVWFNLNLTRVISMPGLPGVTGDLCHLDYQSSVSLERLVKALKYVHPALKAVAQ